MSGWSMIDVRETAISLAVKVTTTVNTRRRRAALSLPHLLRHHGATTFDGIYCMLCVQIYIGI